METISKTLYIEYFPLNTTEDALRDIFSSFGKIKRIELPCFAPEHPLCHGLSKPKTKGYAFLEFLGESDANEACKFFNDLNNIISSEETQMPDKNDGEQKTGCIKSALLSNPEYKAMMPLRVMMKQTFLEFDHRYEEQRLKSLIKTAKLLVITCPNLYD